MTCTVAAKKPNINMLKKYNIFFLVFFCHLSIAHAQSTIDSDSTQFSIPNTVTNNKSLALKSLMLNMKTSPVTKDPNVVLKYNPAFFCLLEDKIEKKSKVPLRFRLGTLEEVDKKEGKH